MISRLPHSFLVHKELPFLLPISAANLAADAGYVKAQSRKDLTQIT
jgi:hypothetical protein